MRILSCEDDWQSVAGQTGELTGKTIRGELAWTLSIGSMYSFSRGLNRTEERKEEKETVHTDEGSQLHPLNQ